MRKLPPDELFPEKFLTLRPVNTEGLTAQDEALWFKRRDASRNAISVIDTLGNGSQAKERAEWVERLQQCRAFIWESNLNLVHYLAYGCSRNHVSLLHEEFISAGSEALLRVVDKFDASRGLRFTTAAWPTILNRLKRVWRREQRGKDIRFYSMNNSKTRWGHARFGDGDTRYDIADVGDAPHVLPETIDFVQSLMYTAVLTEQEKKVIEYRFYEGNTLEDAGKKMGVTKERVRQLQVHALVSLKQEYEAQGKAKAVKAALRRDLIQRMELGGLSSQERAVIRLRYLIEPSMSIGEVADSLKIKHKTVVDVSEKAKQKMKNVVVTTQ